MTYCKRICLSTALLCAGSAYGATLCVSPGTPGCYSHISDAVAAASAGDVINVSGGTYNEGVTITKSLSLVGNGTTIDAGGQLKGIFVNGLGASGLSTGLSGVRISGFTVKNANMEGIFVLDATDVAVSNNTVTNNDQALTPSGCSILLSYEPGEAMDCGEGIHLQAVDHSIVTNNTVQSNAGGGVLVSDDTGPSHHNLLSFNTVSNNAGACGLTLASHIASNATTGNGVFANTLYGNRVMNNGTSGGGGAGVGIFVGAVGGATYGNVVVDNLLQQNGHAGVSMHAHAPNESLNDNMVVGNTIIGNGADAADAATPGPTGVNVYSVPASSGNMISGNHIQSESYDVVTRIPALVQVQFNNLLGLGVGIDNAGAGSVDGTENFFGCPNGPTLTVSCSSVLGNVVYIPYLTVGVSPQPNY